MEKRIGVVGIVIESKEHIQELNQIISQYSENIVGRMGIPYCKAKNLSVISLIVEGTTDEIGALTGKLGHLKGINIKSALTKVILDDQCKEV